jgi:phage terminase large subunit GpA-like protein
MMTRARRALQKWRPPERISTVEWNEKYRRLTEQEAPGRAGKFDTMNVPWVRGMCDALDDPKVWKVVNIKCSQQAWTSAVVIGYILKRIDIDPCNIAIMFAKEREFDGFIEEKLGPAVNATPQLSGKIDVSVSRKAGNKKHFRRFPGGFLKLVGSNSPSSGKSSTLSVVIVEEPDDANTNVKGQGDSIKNLEERTKKVDDRKVIYGGTPTVDGLSAIQDAYEESDKCKYFVPCHDCGETHVLDFYNIEYEKNSDVKHTVYGHCRPESAVYVCPHCASIWDDDQKWQNVLAAETTPGAGWKATAEFRGVRGFGHVGEIYMNGHNSRMERLVERYLEAQHKKEQGEIDDWISFVNNCLGQPFKYDSNNASAETLEERAEDYPEMQIQRGGLIVTIGIDVQDDRFAVCIRAWGIGEESFLVYWGEIFGNAITDRSDPVWDELEQLCYRSFEHADGYEIFASAVSIDSSDGGTSDQVYAWVRAMQKKYRRVTTMAIKGSSDSTDKEIFSTPSSRSIDNKTPTKASKYGLKPYIVGTQKSKDLLYSRLQLTGNGPGRMHCYKTVRADYFEQLTSETKAPSRANRRRMIWQKLSGKRREAPDTERYAMHAARAIKVHLKTPAQWDDIEHNLQQVDLFSAPAAAQVASAQTTQTGSDPYGNNDVYDNVGGGDGWLG